MIIENLSSFFLFFSKINFYLKSLIRVNKCLGINFEFLKEREKRNERGDRLDFEYKNSM